MILTPLDSDYPFRLRNIDDPPAAVYLKTTLSKERLIEIFNMPAIAVVGSRNMTGYGEKMAREFTRKLVEKGIVIVSGMARGIDAVSHRVAIAGNAPTIAILGCGIDVVYPRENRDIWEKADIVLSEFPQGERPLAGNFPKRNRIISGLADAILVIEASRKSGTLITARMAAEQGREVFAVPGPVDTGHSSGTNWLIAQGATPASSAEDIISNINL